MSDQDRTTWKVYPVRRTDLYGYAKERFGVREEYPDGATRHEEALMAALAAPAQLRRAERTLELDAVVVVERVEQRGVVAAQFVHRFDHRRIGPRALDGRGHTGSVAPAHGDRLAPQPA